MIELKILYSNLDKTIMDGVEQVSQYAEQCGSGEAHLLIFNRDLKKSWDEKIWQRQCISASGFKVTTWGS